MRYLLLFLLLVFQSSVFGYSANNQLKSDAQKVLITVKSDLKVRSFLDFMYLGQYQDVETNLYYNRFRYYSPESGTYISQDPIRLAGGMPNMYSYVHDLNSWVDPFGLNEVYTGTVYRGMLTNADGTPLVYSGPTGNGNNGAKSLGLRTDKGEKALSTGIDPNKLEPHRRPPSYDNGTFKKGTMFDLDTKVLDKYGLEAIKDGDNHVSIRTKKGVDPSELADRLAQTKGEWKKSNPC